MGVIRTVVAVGALALSVPAYAQGGRFGGDRSRSEQKSDSRSNDRGNGGARGADPRGTPPSDARTARRAEPRAERPVDRPVVRRVDPRAEPRNDQRNDQRGRPAQPWNRGDDRADRGRSENRDNGRDYGRGNGHAYGRVERDNRGYDHRVYDYDRGRREAVFIGGWFQVHGVSITIRSHMDGRYRYDFRRGLYLDPFVLARLELLPFDLELQLGDLPPYYERRIYGRTVLVIDMRTRMVVDVYDVDW